MCGEQDWGARDRDAILLRGDPQHADTHIYMPGTVMCFTRVLAPCNRTTQLGKYSSV